LRFHLSTEHCLPTAFLFRQLAPPGRLTSAPCAALKASFDEEAQANPIFMVSRARPVHFLRMEILAEYKTKLPQLP
jgi:hypothetical protein